MTLPRTNTIYVDSNRGIWIRDDNSGAVVCLHEAQSISLEVTYQQRLPQYEILLNASEAHIGNADQLVVNALTYYAEKESETVKFKNSLQKGT